MEIAKDIDFFSQLLEETYQHSDKYQQSDFSELETTSNFLSENNLLFAKLTRYKTFLRLSFEGYEIDFPLNRLEKEHIDDYKELLSKEFLKEIESFMVLTCKSAELVVFFLSDQKLLKEYLKNKFKQKAPAQAGALSNVA